MDFFSKYIRKILEICHNLEKFTEESLSLEILKKIKEKVRYIQSNTVMNMTVILHAIKIL